MSQKNNIVQISQSKKDTPQIKSFEKQEWQSSDIEHYGKKLAITKEKYTFVAKDKQNKVQGTLRLTLEANVAFIDSLLISSQHRRMGIGTQLLQQAEHFCKEKKCTKIWLETNEGWGAVAFYKKNGYKVTGTHEKHFLDQRALLFTKFL